MLKVVQEANEANATDRPLLDEIVRDGARAMLAAALRAEVATYPLDQANTALEDLRRGAFSGAAVLIP